jgi:AcrR family transcriptional regulator
VEHEVLQRIMETEPELLLPQLTVEGNQVRAAVAAFLLQYLRAHGVASGVDDAEAADFLARMIMSYMTSPGRWDLDDPAQVSELVRAELLAGIVVGPEPSAPGPPGG